MIWEWSTWTQWALRGLEHPPGEGHHRTVAWGDPRGSSICRSLLLTLFSDHSTSPSCTGSTEPGLEAALK